MSTRKIVPLLLAIILAFGTLPINAYAYNSAREHDKVLEAVLFGDGFSKYKSPEVKTDIIFLEQASYLTIDQFSGNGETKPGENDFSQLKTAGMIGITMKFEDVDYFYLPGTSTQTAATNHRKFTHQGWERDYSAAGKEAAEFWKARRSVLLSTVKKIFDFEKEPLFGYNETIESMAGIIYYVHILGDYDEADNYKKIGLLAALAEPNANDQDKNYGITTSLMKYTAVLFSEQKRSDKYKDLMDGLKEIEEQAGNLEGTTGGINTEEEFEKYSQLATDILTLLKENMPTLLENEDWFREQFYPEKAA